jgi:heme/copper-type cytochrome/quinol oxidase subunit 2
MDYFPQRLKSVHKRLLHLFCFIGILTASGQKLFHPSQYNTTDDLRTFWIIFLICYIVSIISWGIAIYQLVQYVMRDFEKNDKPAASYEGSSVKR